MYETADVGHSKKYMYFLKEVRNMKKHSTSQRFLSALLTVALLLGCLAGFPTTADASVVGELPLTKVADPATVNMWKEYFSADSTANAGGIWTDKSVFVSAEDYINATAEKEDAAAVENLALLDGNDFLVSLSAMASAKSIDGYACIPTDTILILDTSASMQSSGSDDDLVNAANQAIDTLLNLNKHNRIGVVLYSKDAVTILPLDRYQAGDTYKADKVTYQEYLKFITDGSTHSIKVGDKLKNSAGKTVTGTSRPYGWGTFIQSGLDNAMDMFLDAEPQITGDVFQAGTVRLPVTILMSDGAPTYGTTKYNNADTVSMGDSWDATNTLGFVTQLTAAHTKAKVEAHYGRSSLFYTLGLGMDKIEQVGSDDDQAIAKSVMDPSNNTSKIKKYWKDFLADGTVDCTQAGATVTVTHAKKDTVTLEQYATYKNYVTKSFSAKNAAGLNKAFTSIVEAITIQSTK